MERSLCACVLVLLSLQCLVEGTITFNASYSYPAAVDTLISTSILLRSDQQRPVVILELTEPEWPSNVSSRLVSMVPIDGQLQIVGEIKWGYQCFEGETLIDVGKYGVLFSCNVYPNRVYSLSLVSVADNGVLTLKKQWTFPLSSMYTPSIVLDALDPTQAMVVVLNITNQVDVTVFMHLDLKTLHLTTVHTVIGESFMSVLPFFAKGYFVGIIGCNSPPCQSVTIGKYYISKSASSRSLQPVDIGQVLSMSFLPEKNAIVVVGANPDSAQEVMVLDMRSFGALSNNTVASWQPTDIAWISEHEFITTSTYSGLVQWQIKQLSPVAVSSLAYVPGLQFDDYIACANGFCAVASDSEKKLAMLSYS